MIMMQWSLRIKDLKLPANRQESPEDCPFLHNSLLPAHRNTYTAIIMPRYLPLNIHKELGVYIK